MLPFEIINIIVFVEVRHALCYRPLYSRRQALFNTRLIDEIVIGREKIKSLPLICKTYKNSIKQSLKSSFSGSNS
jgi:hypothetical protein